MNISKRKQVDPPFALFKSDCSSQSLVSDLPKWMCRSWSWVLLSFQVRDVVQYRDARRTSISRSRYIFVRAADPMWPSILRSESLSSVQSVEKSYCTCIRNRAPLWKCALGQSWPTKLQALRNVYIVLSVSLYVQYIYIYIYVNIIYIYIESLMPDPHCQKYPGCYGTVLLSVYLTRYSASNILLCSLAVFTCWRSCSEKMVAWGLSTVTPTCALKSNQIVRQKRTCMGTCMGKSCGCPFNFKMAQGERSRKAMLASKINL